MISSSTFKFGWKKHPPSSTQKVMTEVKPVVVWLFLRFHGFSNGQLTLVTKSYSIFNLCVAATDNNEPSVRHTISLPFFYTEAISLMNFYSRMFPAAEYHHPSQLSRNALKQHSGWHLSPLILRQMRHTTLYIGYVLHD